MISTTIRIPEEMRRRIIDLVGQRGMSPFIRQAIERELERVAGATPPAYEPPRDE